VLAAAGPPREPAGIPFRQPCAFQHWPYVPVKVLIGAGDRFFPAGFQRRLAKDRLGIDAVEIPGGHLVALSNPVGLAGRLHAYAAGLPAADRAPARRASPPGGAGASAESAAEPGPPGASNPAACRWPGQAGAAGTRGRRVHHPGSAHSGQRAGPRPAAWHGTQGHPPTPRRTRRGRARLRHQELNQIRHSHKADRPTHPADSQHAS
jgi:hypothetical protein